MIRSFIHIIAIYIIAFMVLSTGMGYSQTIQTFSPSCGTDSSYYHLVKINDNEYWTGGKHGALSKVDTLGNIESIDYPDLGLKILKIEKTENYIFLSTDDAVIYRYDLATKEFIYKKFEGFQSKAFYDLIVTKEGQMLVCGGNTSIVKSSKKFPMGFIAKVDQDLTEMNVVWKSFRKFVWSMIQLPDGKIVAATFNGLNTKLIKSYDGKKWQREAKAKGLVHEIAYMEDKLWYCGARNFYFFKYYFKDGIVGIVGDKKYSLKAKTCQWTICMIDDKIATLNTTGEVILTDKQTSESREINMPSRVPLYDIEKISSGKYLIVGQGKSIYLLDFN